MLLAAAKRSQQLGWLSTVQSAEEQCGSYCRHSVNTLPSRLRTSGDPPSLAREGVWTRSGIPLLRLALIIVLSQYPYKCLNCGGSPPFQGGDAVGCCEAQTTAGVVKYSSECGGTVRFLLPAYRKDPSVSPSYLRRSTFPCQGRSLDAIGHPPLRLDLIIVLSYYPYKSLNLWKLPALSRRGCVCLHAKRRQTLGWLSTARRAVEQCRSDRSVIQLNMSISLPSGSL